MNPEIKTEWTEALLSGKYKQGRSALRNRNDEFCCLGVLCDIAEKHGVVVANPPHETSDFYRYDDRVGGLPESVRQWAGMDDSMGAYGRPDSYMGYRGTLADTNDDGATFEKIAEIIQRNF